MTTLHRKAPFRPFALPTLAIIACLLVSTGLTSLGQEAPPTDDAELTGLLDAARSYHLKLAKSGKALKLHEPSLLNFTNPERNQERGAVYVWLHDDQPAAIGQLFHYNSRTGRLAKHAFHSLAAEPLEAQREGRVAWAPDRPGIAWKSVVDAPPPGPTRVARLLQMRQLARRFRVNLIDPKQKSTELRLVSRPLFEYAAPSAGATQGAIFSYVLATDPEAILLLEAFDEGQIGFRYAFARFHFWQLAATEGEQTVWEVEFDPSMLGNAFGNPATVKKVYNSFLP